MKTYRKENMYSSQIMSAEISISIQSSPAVVYWRLNVGFSLCPACVRPNKDQIEAEDKERNKK